jgi:virginiamycin A acetyltransferase
LKGDTIIGNDVWIGQNSTILPGVRIGNGAIIVMKSVVGNDIEPYTTVAGNPARIIMKRFDEELTELMLKLKWWDLPIKEIIKMIPLLNDNDIENVNKELKEVVK